MECETCDQFERVIKYTQRGYDLSSLTDKYIELVTNILNMENFYKTEKGTTYFNESQEQFKIVLKILELWKRDLSITPEELTTLKSLM